MYCCVDEVAHAVAADDTLRQSYKPPPLSLMKDYHNATQLTPSKLQIMMHVGSTFSIAVVTIVIRR